MSHLARTTSELAKARMEAESITFALREAHRSAINLGALAQRVTASEKAVLEKRKSVIKAESLGNKRQDPSMDFGVTVELRKSGKRSLAGEQKRSLLLFDAMSEFKNDVGSEEDASDEENSKDSGRALTTKVNKKPLETEDSFTYRDLMFYLFDGFPRADLAGTFPTWYEASLWAERINFFFVIMSIVAIATETLPQYYAENLAVFSVIEIICIAYFTMDFVARLLCTPAIGKFMKSILNWVDLVSILPFYIQIIIDSGSGGSGDGVSMLRYFRLLRILRVLKLSRGNVGLMAVWEALRESSEAITLLAFLMMIALLLFSSLMFYAEQYGSTFDDRLDVWIREDGKISPFQSIFHAMWWCIVTMSTVGYGDEVPITVFGKLVGGATMICGVFVLAFPTVILSTNFQEIHQSKVDGHLQMQQIYAAQREAARHRAEERKRRREEDRRLAEVLQAEGSDGGEIVRNDLEVVEMLTTVENDRTTDHILVPERPKTFPFIFDPYGPMTSRRPAIAIRNMELFKTDTLPDSNVMHREVVLMSDQVAMYNPALHFVCQRGGLRVKVEQCLSRSVVTIKLALESVECQRAAEDAVAQHRPDLYGKVMILPRPISKLKIDVVCDHPLLHDVRLQCSTFTEPAGVVPLSLVVPYPSLISVLLANMSSLSVMTWISYEGPSAVDEPLYHYGGAVLAGTDFEEEELDFHARSLIADATANIPPPIEPASRDVHRQSPPTSVSPRALDGDDAPFTVGLTPPQQATAAFAPSRDWLGSSGAFDEGRPRINLNRRASLDPGRQFTAGVARSPNAQSLVAAWPSND